MNQYYTLLSEHTDAMHGAPSEAVGRFAVLLCPDADVYRGHFPGHPVAPGVCNLEMIRELASRLAGRELRYAAVRQCKFTQLISPDGEPLTVSLTLSGDRLSATLSRLDTPCLTLKATVR